MATAIVAAFFYFGVIYPEKVSNLTTLLDEFSGKTAEAPTLGPPEQQLPSRLGERQASYSLSPEALAAKEALDRAFERYRSILTGGTEGDIDAANAEYMLAVERCLALVVPEELRAAKDVFERMREAGVFEQGKKSNQVMEELSSKEDVEQVLLLMASILEGLPRNECHLAETYVYGEDVNQAFDRYRAITIGIAAGERARDDEYETAREELFQALSDYENFVETQQ